MSAAFPLLGQHRLASPAELPPAFAQVLRTRAALVKVFRLQYAAARRASAMSLEAKSSERAVSLAQRSVPFERLQLHSQLSLTASQSFAVSRLARSYAEHAWVGRCSQAALAMRCSQVGPEIHYTQNERSRAAGVLAEFVRRLESNTQVRTSQSLRDRAGLSVCKGALIRLSSDPFLDFLSQQLCRASSRSEPLRICLATAGSCTLQACTVTGLRLRDRVELGSCTTLLQTIRVQVCIERLLLTSPDHLSI